MYDWNFNMILSGYESLWVRGAMITMAYAVGTVVGGF